MYVRLLLNISFILYLSHHDYIQLMQIILTNQDLSKQLVKYKFSIIKVDSIKYVECVIYLIPNPDFKIHNVLT